MVISFKRIGRFQHVVDVLIKYGFGEVLRRIRIWECVHISGRLLRRTCQIPGLTLPQRIHEALEELGPTYIKLGQVLSTRPDIVPHDIILELKKLQSSAHFVSVQEIKNVIESELKQPIDSVYDSFDETPLAAASLAQVHRAVYHGNEVALKVQRPGIVEIIEEDIAIMRAIAGLAERYSHQIYLINPVGLVNEFAEQIQKELDFGLEAHNMRRFAKNFAGDDFIHVPEVYLEVTTKKLITMEFLNGISIIDIQRLRDEGYNTRLIARRGAILGYKSTFEYGFFHADPHPGNIFVLPDNVIGLVDFGMMATLSQRDRERLSRLVYFLSMEDDIRVARALNELMETEDVIPAEKLEPAMAALIQQYGGLPVSEPRHGAMLFAMMRAVMDFGARLRPQLVWLTKSIAIQEDIANVLKAEFSVMDLARPYAQKVLTERLNIFRRPRELLYWLNESFELMKDLPYSTGTLIRELRKGKIKIEFEHVGLEPIRLSVNRAANRMSIAFLIAALLISASLIVLAKVPPFIGGIPLLGFIGYIFAIVLGFILAVSIINRSR